METLTAPADQEFLDQFGEEPRAQDEPWIRQVDFKTENGTLELSFDEHQKSIRFEWRQGNDVVWHFFRECATSLSIRAENQETHLVAEFETEELSGTVDVRVFPLISIHDSSLRR